MDIDQIVGYLWSQITLIQCLGFLFLGITRHVLWLALVTLTFTWKLIHELIVDYNTSSKWPGITSNDIALVTGGSHGLGRAIVNNLLEKNVKKVIIFDIEPPGSSDARCEYVKCDLNDSNDLSTKIDRLVGELASKDQHISILVNNAGIRINGSVLEVSEDDINRSMQINFVSPVLLIQRVIKQYMAKNNGTTTTTTTGSTSTAAMSPLTIVSVASVLGWISPCRLSLYSAAKAALINANQSLMRELKAYDQIRILYATPGQLDTRMFADVEPPKQFFAPVVKRDDLAKAIVDRIERGQQGNLCRPLYTNVVPLVSALPLPLQDLIRDITGIDKCI
ncbi:uncharacterized protein KQ657_005170 [Scheffersomyces spartinae]|uniref:NAD(P)-binding protein n=1 Tax=Scheffersomyces spartinae TaxID=45513 RepID=A0A9P7VAD7_9ASCO|nr:uncharacterized protein KQ657_005170 [Scheffersomyces spartinae]KAG7193971.1 hypothetical protein KQ657_005170 [Scheffersomyces spartinae]